MIWWGMGVLIIRVWMLCNSTTKQSMLHEGSSLELQEISHQLPQNIMFAGTLFSDFYKYLVVPPSGRSFTLNWIIIILPCFPLPNYINKYLMYNEILGCSTFISHQMSLGSSIIA